MAELRLERGARLSLFAVPRAAGGHQVVEEGDGVVLGVVTEGSVAGNLAEPTKGHTVAGPRGVSNDVALPVEEGVLMRREGLAGRRAALRPRLRRCWRSGGQIGSAAWRESGGQYV